MSNQHIFTKTLFQETSAMMYIKNAEWINAFVTDRIEL